MVLSTVDPTHYYNIGEILLLCLIGIAIVILALAVLIVLIMGISKVIVAIEKALDNRANNKTTAPVATASPVSPTAEDEETVAAITAALLAFYEVSADEEAVPPPFVIRSIKKI